MYDLTKAFVAEWNQALTAMFQHLVESLSGRLEAAIVEAVNAHDFGTRCSTFGHVVYVANANKAL